MGIEEKIFENLNAEQAQAIRCTEGYVRVAAGAGSGKTRVLTNRYVYVAKVLGVPAEHILSVTFTNKAAWEMRKRIRAALPDEDGGWILTFHSACHKILQSDISCLAYPSNFIVLDEEDQKGILQRIFDENGLTLKNFSFRRCLDALEVYKSQNAYVPFLTDPARKEIAPGLADADDKGSMSFVILKYLQSQRKNFYLDFNDLIQFVLYLFQTREDIAQKWQKKFEYIQIDEFQDVSAEQYQLACVLSAYHKNLFIVGDPDQTIYSWRGASVGYFLNFDKRFEGTQTIVLDKNYRSTPEILGVSNSLISHNTARLKKKLNAVRKSGATPCYYHAKSRAEESEWIASSIQSLHEAGTPLRDIAILYRGNYMSRPIEEALIKKNIPYAVYSGVAFYQRKEIKDALAYLRFLACGDELSFLRIVNVPPRGIGKTRLALLAERARTSGWMGALKELSSHEKFKATKAAQLVQALEASAEYARSHDAADTLDFLLQKSGYEEYLMLCGNQDKLDNLNELKSSLREYLDEAQEEVSIDDYLNGIALLTSADMQDRENCVRLMTIHTAKGLEFPVVFVCCMNEGMFPSRKIRSKEEMEEERRVAYVAMTRAENLLFLSDAEGYDAQAGGSLYSSRFLFNIDEKLLEKKGVPSEQHMRRSKEYIRQQEFEMGVTDAPPNIRVFAAGEEVRHPHFGAGKILSVQDGEYLVAFENGKTRSVSVSSDVLIPLYR